MQALQIVIDKFITIGYDLSAIDWIGHRVVHGGEYFKNPVIIDDEVVKRIEECVDLAPLHNPANLQAILACKELLPDVKQVAVFDTAFYQSMKPVNYLYALPIKYYEKYKIRRYGFHGISHQYVYKKLVETLKRWNVKTMSGSKPLKVITCHIGNGASITAIKDGKVIETSMGMTPLEWLMMWTRSWDIDPALISHIMKHKSFTIDQVMNVLNKESGLLWISEISNDVREILAGVDAGNEKCILALEMYINSMVKYIWSYVALLGWVDAIVLTAGVMEHRWIIRKMLVEKLWRLGIVLDEQVNVNEISLVTNIATQNSQVAVFIIPTNEELMIAEETLKLMINNKW